VGAVVSTDTGTLVGACDGISLAPGGSVSPPVGADEGAIEGKSLTVWFTPAAGQVSGVKKERVVCNQTTEC
jgi:hypothetical protein